MSDAYDHAHDLGRSGEVGADAGPRFEKLKAWDGAVFAAGALSEREKAPIARGVSHAVPCPSRIDADTRAALDEGSHLEETTEAVHVAAAIRGGASLVHGVPMRNAAQKPGT